jgi:hypothetical protein
MAATPRIGTSASSEPRAPRVEPTARVPEASSDPPCDFTAFLAEGREITYEQAEQLLQSWLMHYHPRGGPPTTSGAAPEPKPEAVLRCRADDICS